MATSYNPYNASLMSLPKQQDAQYQQKVNQQVAQRSGPRAHPERIKAIAAGKRIPRVRVEPASDELRRALRHPNGMAFRTEGSVEWPLDRFTRRRIAEGSIKVVEDAEARGKNNKPQQQLQSRRERASAPPPPAKSE